MIALPDPQEAFHHENAFYLTCPANRLAKLLAHYELYKRTLGLSGALVECGVYKGASLLRFAMFRAALESNAPRSIIGFDSFGEFPETSFEADKRLRERFVEAAGSTSIAREQLRGVLASKGCNEGVTLVEGDICETVPAFLAEHPDLRISLLHLDVDIYEPSVVVLEHLFPRLVPGGLLILDDYNSFPGETKAADDYFAGTEYAIEPSALYPSVHLVVKK